MPQQSAHTTPAIAESEGDHLFVWLNDSNLVRGDLVPTFVGKYTIAKVDEAPLVAQGEVTYKGIQTFGEEDEGKFRVTKKLDNDGSEYYEIYIKYHGEESWFKGKGKLREGAEIGKWEWTPAPSYEKATPSY